MLVNENEDEHLSALWLTTLQSLTDSVVHDIRNALNGVAVNLEVVRSRSARGPEAGSVASFAAAAATQFETVTSQVDALVELIRSRTDGRDVAILLGRLAPLLRHSSRAEPIHIETPLAAQALTAAPPAAVRLATVSALLAGRAREGAVTCRLGAEEPPTVYIQCVAGGPIALPTDIAAALGTVGISLVPSDHGIMISFPPAPRDDGL